MDFSTFFLYFTASSVIHAFLVLGIKFLLFKHQQRKMKQLQDNNQVVTMDDIVNLINQQAEEAEPKTDKGKKTWN